MVYRLPAVSQFLMFCSTVNNLVMSDSVVVLLGSKNLMTVSRAFRASEAVGEGDGRGVQTDHKSLCQGR